MSKLPDLDDFVQLGQEINALTVAVELYKHNLDEIKAEITDTVTSREKYHINGRSPSMSYIQNHYHVIGYDDESKGRLDTARTTLFSAQGELKEKELLYQSYRLIIDVWRTESANKRNSHWDV